MEFELILEVNGNQKLEFDALSSVEVSEQLGQPRTFTLTFSDDVCSGEYKLLQLQALDPLNSINIAVKRKEKKWYLIKGFIQSHSITVKNEGAGSQLQVSGVDNSARLGWVEEKWRWPKDLDDEEIFTLLSKVSVKNSKGKLKDTKISQHSFDEYHISDKEYKKGKQAKVVKELKKSSKNGILQSSDDLSFIQRIGKQTSRYFWVSYENGKEIANFRQLPLKHQPEITLDVGGKHNNIDQLSINWDINRPSKVKNKQLDPNKSNKSKEASKDGANQEKLAKDPVTLEELSGGYLEGYISSPSTSSKNMKDKSDSALNEAEWFIKASCSTTFFRLCKYQNWQASQNGENPDIKLIQAHSLVNVKGTGKRYDGKYLVSGVTHSITPDSYDIQIQLQRNAWERTPKKSTN